jgi:hypothetical protein
MPWFMSGIQRGRFHVVNPYNQKVSEVPASPEHVHTIVFWSKNFGSFLAGNYGERLAGKGYHLFFNFTINSPHPVLEPHLPPLRDRLVQLKRLCRRFGPGTIQWRFDPICIFTDAEGRLSDNLDCFEQIAGDASDLGISVCITSLVDHYRKVQRRVGAQSEVALLDPPLTEQADRVCRLAETVSGLGMQLQLCCERELLDHLGSRAPIGAAACIPSQRLIELFGPGISTAKDKGQRRAAGCGCGVSKDIGSYPLHPCRHNCLYCYANPAADASG